MVDPDHVRVVPHGRVLERKREVAVVVPCLHDVGAIGPAPSLARVSRLPVATRVVVIVRIRSW